MTEDQTWYDIQKEAQEESLKEPLLTSYLYSTIVTHDSLEKSLAFHLAHKLAKIHFQPISMMELLYSAYEDDFTIRAAIRADLNAIKERDPACKSFLQPILNFKGFHALQSFRAANWLWKNDRKQLALFLQSRIAEVFNLDIHPAATVGRGILLDHATGIVVGETAVIGNNVSILHEVTLGGTGKDSGDRHPKIGDGVLIGAGAKILGNVKIGECAKIGACSVVLTDVPAHSTAAGVPAKVVGETKCDQPALEMNHNIDYFL